MRYLFPCRPAYAHTDDPDLRRMTRQYSVGMPEIGARLFVRSEFFTDGASVPRLGWTTFGHPFGEPQIYAGLLHDACYTGELWVGTEARDWRVWFNLAQANRMFYDMLCAKGGMCALRCWEYWQAVRLYGATFGRRNYITQDKFRAAYPGAVASLKELETLTGVRLPWIDVT